MEDALDLVDWDSVSLVVLHGENAHSTEVEMSRGLRKVVGSREASLLDAQESMKHSQLELEKEEGKGRPKLNTPGK